MLIKAFARGRNTLALDSAWRVFDVVGREARPTSHLFGALIDACIKCEQPGRALPLLDAMSSQGIPCNAVCVTLLAIACAEQKDAKTAMEAPRNFGTG